MGALVGALRAMLTLDSTQFVSGAGKAQRSSKKLESSMANLGSMMKKVGLGLSVAAAGISYAIKGQLNYIDQLGEMSEKIGVPVKELSRLAYAAQVTGVPLETLEKSLVQLSKGMVEAANGGKAAETFKKLGVHVLDASGKMRSSEAVLQDLSDRFKEMPDGAQKTALAMEMFGKSGAEMMLMLNNGGDGLRVLTEEAKKMGLEITEEQAKSAGKFNENLDKLGTLAKGLGVKLAAALSPALEAVTNWLIEFVTVDFPQFIESMKQLFADISAKLSEMAASIRETFGEIGTWMSETWAGIKTTIGGAIDYVQGKWDTFVASLKEAIQIAKDVAAAVAEALKVGGDGVLRGPGSGGPTRADVAKGLTAGGAGGAAGGQMMGAAIVNGMVIGAVEALKARQQELADVFGQVAQIAKDKLGINSPSRVFREEVGARITEGLALGIRDNKPMVDAAMDEVGDAIEGKADSFKSAFESMRSTLSSTFSGLVKGALSFKDALSQVIGKLADMLANAAFEGLMGAGGDGILGGILKALGFADGGAFLGGRLMAFANGGVVSGATAFAMQGGLGVMGEAGPEAIMPLARGRGGKLGVMAQGGGSSRVQIEITENPMFASRVEGIADGRAVQVVRKYDREIAPQTRTRNPRERG